MNNQQNEDDFENHLEAEFPTHWNGSWLDWILVTLFVCIPVSGMVLVVLYKLGF